ncbi:MAG: UV DNA damage repair endonuclease UvsE [Longimicrobiaceae bacterium]
MTRHDDSRDRRSSGGERLRRRLGFAVKVVGRPGLKSNDARRWRSDPHLRVSLDYLRAILDYLEEIDVRMYRMSSDFVPYATHPDLPRFHGQIRECAEELAEVGALARGRAIRLSLHPSQYVVLNAEDPEVRAKSVADVESQAELLDALEQGPEAVVVLHLGGAYGNREAALGRFVASVGKLSEPGRRRLVVENDETLYTVEDCLRVHEQTGLRVVFDHHHRRLNPGGLASAAALRAALATWSDGVVPKVHFSSPRLDARQVKRRGELVEIAPLLSQHADYVNPWEFAGLLGDLGERPCDVMLEAKRKDLALLKLRADLSKLGLGKLREDGVMATGTA